MLTVVILAGGLAQRLRPITESIPKSLIEVSGRPFIAWQLDYLKSQGIENVVLCCGYLGELIEKLIGDGSEYGLKVKYSYDGEILLGTGGALKKALPLLENAFFVLYGDSYLPICFKAIQERFLYSGKLGVMTVLKNMNQWDKSNVIFENSSIVQYSKTNFNPLMHYIDYGLAIIDANIFNTLNFGSNFDLGEVYSKLADTGDLVGYEVHDRFYEIGSLKGITAMEAYLNKINNLK